MTCAAVGVHEENLKQERRITVRIPTAGTKDAVKLSHIPTLIQGGEGRVDAPQRGSPEGFSGYVIFCRFMNSPAVMGSGA